MSVKLLIAGSFELDEHRRAVLEDMGYDIIISPREDSYLGAYINTIKLRKNHEQNVNFTENLLTKQRKSEVSLPAAMKPIEIGV